MGGIGRTQRLDVDNLGLQTFDVPRAASWRNTSNFEVVDARTYVSELQLAGADVVPPEAHSRYNFGGSRIENLPFLSRILEAVSSESLSDQFHDLAGVFTRKSEVIYPDSDDDVLIDARFENWSVDRSQKQIRKRRAGWCALRETPLVSS